MKIAKKRPGIWLTAMYVCEKKLWRRISKKRGFGDWCFFR